MEGMHPTKLTFPSPAPALPCPCRAPASAPPARHGAVTVAMGFKSFASNKGDDRVIMSGCNGAVIFVTVVLGGMTHRLLRCLLPAAEEGSGGGITRGSTLATMPSIDLDGASLLR